MGDILTNRRNMIGYCVCCSMGTKILICQSIWMERYGGIFCCIASSGNGSMNWCMDRNDRNTKKKKKEKYFD